MNFKTVFKPTTATLGFIIFSACIFYLGYSVGGLIDTDKVINNLIVKEKIKEKDKIIYSFLLSLIIPGAAAVNFFINKQIEDESDKIIQEAQKDCDNKIRDNVLNYLRSLEKVERVLLQFNNDQSQKCLIELAKSKSDIQNYFDNYSAAKVMVKWLDNDDCRRDLITEIVFEIEKRYKIHQESEFRSLFADDIGKCLNWLRDSIDILGSRPVDKNYMTQAFGLNKIDKSAYRYALTEVVNEYFKNQQTLKTLCLENSVLESDVIRILKYYAQELLRKMDIL